MIYFHWLGSIALRTVSNMRSYKSKKKSTTKKKYVNYYTFSSRICKTFLYQLLYFSTVGMKSINTTSINVTNIRFLSAKIGIWTNMAGKKLWNRHFDLVFLFHFYLTFYHFEGKGSTDWPGTLLSPFSTHEFEILGKIWTNFFDPFWIF